MVRRATTPPSNSNSMPRYRHSVFSLTMTKSIPGLSEGTWGRVLEGLMFA